MGKESELISTKELQRITEEKELQKLREALETKKKIETDAAEVHKAFMERDIRPDAKQRITTAVRRAAERGERRVMIMRFPSSWCTDHGRAINNFESDWPSTLTGFAQRAYEYYKKEVQPEGYKLQAQILDYPGGMPGDVGIFLAW